MNLILDLIGIFLLAIIPACFSFFLDYTLGHPMSDNVSTKAILFRYSYWLAKRKLPLAKYRELVKIYEPLLNHEDPNTREDGKTQLKTSIMVAGRDYFFWEQAVGMCPFCTNFWVSLIYSIVVYFALSFSVINPIFILGMIPVISHTILRKL